MGFFIYGKDNVTKNMWEVIIMNETFAEGEASLPLLLGMGMPMVLSMLVIPLLCCGQLFCCPDQQERHGGAVLVFPIQEISSMPWPSVSEWESTLLIATARGAGKENEARRAATQGVVLSVIHGIILAAACIAIMPWFLGMFTRDQEVIHSGVRYASIAFLFSPIITCFGTSMAFRKKDLSGSGTDEGVHDRPARRLRYEHYFGSDFNLWTGILSENGDLRRGGATL